MSITYNIKVTAIATTTVGSLSGVIKRVDFSVKGTKDGYTYEIAESTELADPVAESFTVLANVSEADVISWITTNYTNLDATKSHVEFMLDNIITKAQLVPTPLPWTTE
jgi:hypothetical protein